MHGAGELEGAADAFEAALKRGRATLQKRHKTNPPSWLLAVEAACGAPLVTHGVIGDSNAAGAFYAWAAPVPPAVGGR